MDTNSNTAGGHIRPEEKKGEPRVTVTPIIGLHQLHIIDCRLNTGFVFGHDQCSGRETLTLKQMAHDKGNQPLMIRRIHKDKVEMIPIIPEATEIPGNIPLNDSYAVAQVAMGQIFSQQRQGGSTVVDEYRGFGTAAQGLDPQGPGAREEVQHMCVHRTGCDDVKQGLSHPVGGRAHLQPFEGVQSVPPEPSTDDSHGASFPVPVF